MSPPSPASAGDSQRKPLDSNAHRRPRFDLSVDLDVASVLERIRGEVPIEFRKRRAGAAASNPVTASLRGAAVMLLFGLGTTPTLVGIAWAAKQFPIGLRVGLQKLAGAVVAVSGLLLILHSWRIP